MAADETPLMVWGGGAVPRAHLSDGVVLRDARPWSPSVIVLLQHLEVVGFDGAPRVVGDGMTADGREAVTYVPGTSPHPHAWDDEALFTVGRLVRQLHDATASFVPPAGAIWQPWFGRHLTGTDPIIGHCDTGPWNIVGPGNQPTALIDWEFAGPVDRIWELAHTAWLNAQLHDDDIADRFNLPSPEQRARQLRLLIDGYGLAAAERADFVEKLIAIAVHSARDEAIQHQVTPDTTAAIDDNGYPVLWGITWRTRSAGWMLQHRRLLDNAIR